MIRKTMKRTVVMAAMLAMVAFATVTMAKEEDKTMMKGDAKAHVQTMNEKFSEAMKNGDGKVVAALFTEDGMMMTPNFPVVKGHADLATNFNQPMDVRLKMHEVEVAGDWAWEDGSYTYHSADGVERDKGKYVIILKKTGEGWKIHRNIYNSDVSQMPAEE